MGPFSLASAVVALAVLALPGAGKYLAIGLGILAFGTGIIGWRRGTSRGRLAGAAGVALGVVAIVLGATKLGLTLVALDRLSRILSD